MYLKKNPVSLISMKLLLLSFFIYGCGGSGGGSSSALQTATGVFKDSNVSGMSYVSGNQSGTTGPDGNFTYEVGQSVNFSIGGVTVGNTQGRSVVTPVDLVPGGNTNSVTVQNITRFLMMLDRDGDPTNGIEISSAVQTASTTWTTIDLSAANLAVEAAQVVANASAVDGVAHVLPTPTAAKTHITSTLRCTYAGAFKGTYSGSDSGRATVFNDSSTALITGFGYSVIANEFFNLSGTNAIDFGLGTNFVSGSVTTGSSFSGQFSSPDNAVGSWSHPLGSSGSFSLQRIGGGIGASYRFTGSFSGTNQGLFTFDLSNSDQVTGVAYDIYDDATYSVSGSLNGTSLSATASGSGQTIQINGTMNKTTGALSGSWVNAGQATSGSFAGSGCQLN